MTTCRFEELGHTSEIGLRIHADAPELLFACAARGMFSLLRVPLDLAQPPRTHHIHVESLDGESLLVDWLNELLYLYEMTGALYNDCTVTHWTHTQLDAIVCGYPPAATPAVQIKAVTYHQLQVQADAGGWRAQVFFDI
jgi:SHS2 domain-containing protein